MIISALQTIDLPSFRTPSESGLAPIPPTLFKDHLEIADRVISNWKNMAQSVIANDRIEFLHNQRNSYREVVNDWINNLEAFYRLLQEMFSPDFDDVLPVMADVQKSLRRIKEFSHQLFSRWETQEDLEILLAEEIALPNEILIKLAARFPPPPEWLERDEPKPW